MSRLGRPGKVAPVGLLLHLSDLHLVPAGVRDDVTGDYKLDLVPAAERQRRTQTIRDTLHQLGAALDAAGVTLDAIVITGDVTLVGGREGIDMLPEVLAELGTARPHPDRILIVPGNHDVTWRTPPGSTERYEQFLTLRGLGYRTAYLDGPDGTIDKLTPDGIAALPPLVVARDNSYVVVGLNSSDMCGVQRPTEDAVATRIGEIEAMLAQEAAAGAQEGALKALYDAWWDRGLYDVPRVSAFQRRICSDLSARARAEITDAGYPEPVMIAAFHHQLRPVSSAEEVTAFEGITNQGEVREWLAANRFDILVHGHKHDPRVLKDDFVPYGRSYRASPHRLLVVSGPTIGHGQPASGPVGRLISVQANAPRIEELTLTLVPATAAGVPIHISDLVEEQYAVGNDDGVRLGLLEADTASQVYDKIRAAEKQFPSLPTPLVCRIRDGSTALRIPDRYPDRDGAEKDDAEPASRRGTQAWLNRTVDWWQDPDRGPAASFNHGERIRGGDQAHQSQFDSAIASLRANVNSSRAIIMVIRPTTDFDAPDRDFPAFALVQFLVRNGSLNITGFFRKQEMPHWWPINVAELASLQSAALERLRLNDIKLAAGSICTVTALPVTGPSAPRVVIPEIDRRANSPAKYLELVVPLYFGGASSAEMVARWTTVIDDWLPQEQGAADGDPVPVIGLANLAAHAEACAALAATSPTPDGGDPLINQLRQLHTVNKLYAESQQLDDRVVRHAQWRAEVLPRIADVFRLVSLMADDISSVHDRGDDERQS